MDKPKNRIPRGAAATRAKNTYRDANYDRMELAIPKGQKTIIKEHAALMGESVNSFVFRAISEAMERDKGGAK